MSESRLVAFTDGIIAIIITVMVLEFKTPSATSFAALWALRHEFAVYLFSYLALAVYWVNHHHLFQLVRHVSTPVLWANMIYLLTLSFFPFATAWLGSTRLTALVPAMFYGGVNLLANLGYGCLVWTLMRDNRKLREPVRLYAGSFRKNVFSVAANVVAMASAFVWPPLVLIIDGVNLIVWAVPDRRIERHVWQKQHKNL
ncbi:TMEM175 family protein [Lacticaseibacillus sharpeae]|uniref:Integral membrane protein n=1 Tax=Lacticaseibacillus sharpeae JCM 1186 = DSM 20505 TaxID=1291052 RepID=A0A0R1ZVQ4_9LACO|nr:TMEM175 family protein [Lacticaseibacillus sharpeae]KRM55862.1 integral membrane protein [Lacticaseibacillus sharpeae JCM 1186 = DSM 20505]